MHDEAVPFLEKGLHAAGADDGDTGLGRRTLLPLCAADADCGVILAGARGFTGAAGSRAGDGYVNAGAMGRPAIYGRTCVWYATLSTDADRLEVGHVPVRYDHEALGSRNGERGHQ